MVKLELTEEELQFIYDRCSSKAARLEDSNLEDTPCYRLSWIIMGKINKVMKEINFTPTTDVKPIDSATVPEPTKPIRDYWAEDVEHMKKLGEWQSKQWNY